MLYFFLHLNNTCHFYCFRVHVYNALLVLQKVLLASMLGIMQVYSVAIFTSFNVLFSRWCSVVHVWCVSWKHYLFILLQNSLQTTRECGPILQGTMQKHRASVSAPGNLQFYHYIFRKNWKHDICPGKQGQRTIFLWRFILCFNFSFFV